MQLIEDDFPWAAYSEPADHQKVIRPSSLMAEVELAFYGNEESKGDLMPWRKTHDHFRYRKREVTLYAGINGHRKSTTTSQIEFGFAKQGKRSLLMSFEMRPTQSMKRMTQQASGTDQPSVGYLRDFHRWTDDRIWIYDHFGHCPPAQVLAVARYAVAELGVEHVFIDSMMKVVRDSDDYNGQKRFIDDLCALALSTDTHVHVIAHAKKGQSDTDRINKFSIKGASEITDQVDNVILLQKNLTKERRKLKADEQADDAPDFWMTIDKQRNAEFEGTVGLWFQATSMSLVEREGAQVGSWPVPGTRDGDLVGDTFDDEAEIERAAMQAGA